LSDSDLFVDEADLDEESATGDEGDRRSRRWYGLLALVLLLLLLLCCATTTVDVLVTRGPQQAQFISRNLACLQCHSEKIPDFSKKSVHSPFMHRDCTVCHTPHGSQMVATVRSGASSRVSRYLTLVQWLPLKWWFDSWSALSGSSSTSVETSAGGTLISKTTRGVTGATSNLTMPEDKLCWTCHGDLGGLLGDTYTHMPFAKGRCTECHDPHASDNSSLLKQPANKLCFTCHPIGKELNRMQAHPPAKQGWCTDCHNPHASNYKGILVARQRELCFTCHPTVAVLSTMPTQHQPFANDNCTGCHEPHGSDNSPLLVEAQPALCYGCHPQIKNQFAQPSHHPIGLNLTCGSCHNPHAAQYPKLLSAQNNAFCYQCHGDKQPGYEDSAHSVNDCVVCHSPHGSAYAPMLLKKQPDLCLQCHPDAQGSNKHPVTPKYYDLHAHKGLTCTSSCHNPHGSKYDFMMRSYDWKQDGLCLQCHKTVGVYY
jgi:predicted CXXCH cytochrome family protein